MDHRSASRRWPRAAAVPPGDPVRGPRDVPSKAETFRPLFSRRAPPASDALQVDFLFPAGA